MHQPIWGLLRSSTAHTVLAVATASEGALVSTKITATETGFVRRRGGMACPSPDARAEPARDLRPGASAGDGNVQGGDAAPAHRGAGTRSAVRPRCGSHLRARHGAADGRGPAGRGVLRGLADGPAV